MYGSSHPQNIHDKSQCAQTIMCGGTPTTMELTNLPMISKPNLVVTEQQVRRMVTAPSKTWETYPKRDFPSN